MKGDGDPQLRDWLREIRRTLCINIKERIEELCADRSCKNSCVFTPDLGQERIGLGGSWK